MVGGEELGRRVGVLPGEELGRCVGVLPSTVVDKTPVAEDVFVLLEFANVVASGACAVV